MPHWDAEFDENDILVLKESSEYSPKNIIILSKTAFGYYEIRDLKPFSNVELDNEVIQLENTSYFARFNDIELFYKISLKSRLINL